MIKIEEVLIHPNKSSNSGTPKVWARGVVDGKSYVFFVLLNQRKKGKTDIKKLISLLVSNQRLKVSL
jgi:hypothetical protein